MNSGNTDFEKAGQVVLNLTDEQLEGVSGGWGSKCEGHNYCFDDGRNPGE